jgi:hypothetical protein
MRLSLLKKILPPPPADTPLAGPERVLAELDALADGCETELANKCAKCALAVAKIGQLEREALTDANTLALVMAREAHRRLELERAGAAERLERARNEANDARSNLERLREEARRDARRAELRPQADLRQRIAEPAARVLKAYEAMVEAAEELERVNVAAVAASRELSELGESTAEPGAHLLLEPFVSWALATHPGRAELVLRQIVPNITGLGGLWNLFAPTAERPIGSSIERHFRLALFEQLTTSRVGPEVSGERQAAALADVEAFFSRRTLGEAIAAVAARQAEREKPPVLAAIPSGTRVRREVTRGAT